MNLDIYSNGQLQNLAGLSSLTSIGGRIYIRDNPRLTKCCAIAPLLNTPGAVGGTIDIYHNATGCESEQVVRMDECVPSCTFSAQAVVDNTINISSACDLSGLPAPITDYTQLFTNVGDTPCGDLVLDFAQSETGDLCTGLSVESASLRWSR